MGLGCSPVGKFENGALGGAFSFSILVHPPPDKFSRCHQVWQPLNHRTAHVCVNTLPNCMKFSLFITITILLEYECNRNRFKTKLYNEMLKSVKFETLKNPNLFQ